MINCIHKGVTECLLILQEQEGLSCELHTANSSF